MPPSAPEDAPPPEARGGGERVSMSGAAGSVPRASRASASASASAASAAGAARCRVVARFRPLTAREAESGERCVDCGSGSGGSGSGGAPAHQVSVVGASAEPLPFAFDAVLPERASQEEVFACVARETADRVQQGYNGASCPACACACSETLCSLAHRSCGCAACAALAMRRALTRHARADAALPAVAGAIIAYGQSGSGKTFTMGTAGASCSADAKGIIPRIVAHLLADDAGAGGTGAPACVITLTLVEVYKERIRCGGSRPAGMSVPFRQCIGC